MVFAGWLLQHRVGWHRNDVDHCVGLTAVIAEWELAMSLSEDWQNFFLAELVHDVQNASQSARFQHLPVLRRCLDGNDGPLPAM